MYKGVAEEWAKASRSPVDETVVDSFKDRLLPEGLTIAPLLHEVAKGEEAIDVLVEATDRVAAPGKSNDE